MGRAMIIICAALLVALGFTFLGVSTTREGMNRRNINTYYATKAKNTANSGIQLAIQKFNNDKTTFTDYETTFEDADLELNLHYVSGKQDTIRVKSKSTYRNAEHTVIAIFDISNKQRPVPPFTGALTKVGDADIDFKTGNHKIHFDGNAPDGAPCDDKPGMTVPDQSEMGDYDDLSQISGNPSIAVDKSIKMDYITELVDALEPQATVVNDGSNFTSTPNVYIINDYTHLSGQTEGSGILIVKNDATLDVDAGVNLTGKFTFNGLVILENGSKLSGSGNAAINGSVIAASNSASTYIKPNGNFDTQYDCRQQDTANQAVGKLLNTTIYKRLSIYE